MNINQRTLIDLILVGINKDYNSPMIDESVDIELLYEEAIAHQVHTLIYPTLLKYSKENAVYQPFVDKRKVEFLQDVALQEAHANQMNKVLSAFHSKNIPVIILKGLVLRDYYPDPTLRLMGDGDILVKDQDIKDAKALLQSLGYKEGKSTLRHIGFHCNGFPEIELHTILSDSEIDYIGDKFTDTVWDNAILTTYQTTPTLKLSIYNQVIHLILHASQHMNAGGFGLRQLCDIVLFLQAHKEDIDLDTLVDITHKYQIHRFSMALLAVCHKLFHINISTPNLNDLDENFIDLFIEDIFDAGVFGRKTAERANSSKLIKYMDTKNTEGKLSKAKYFFSFFFPSHKIIKKNYHYVINHPYLLPVAWIHRVIRNIGRLFAFRLNDNAKQDQDNRFKLLLWLQLR